MYKNKSIAVVVPAFNEEAFIATVIKRIPEYVDKVYIINDASTDKTFEVATETIGAKSSGIKIIKNQKNSGVGRSIAIGYKNSLDDNIDIAVVMAGDNQMDPDEMPGLLDPVIEGIADYTAGDRLSKRGNTKGMPPWRHLGNRILRILTRIAAWNFKIADPQHGYTAITRETLMKLDLDKIYPRYGYLNDLLVKFSVLKVRVLYVSQPAVYGDEKSKIRYWRYIPTVSWLLLRDCLWRIRVQALGADKNPAANKNG